MWGRCRSCEAKDKEIEHLLALLKEANAQTEKAQARLADIASPGVAQRLEPRPVRPPREVPVAAPTVQFPGYAPSRRPVDLEIG